MRCVGTPTSFASRQLLMPSGLRDSWTSIASGETGLSSGHVDLRERQSAITTSSASAPVQRKQMRNRSFTRVPRWPTRAHFSCSSRFAGGACRSSMRRARSSCFNLRDTGQGIGLRRLPRARQQSSRNRHYQSIGRINDVLPSRSGSNSSDEEPTSLAASPNSCPVFRPQLQETPPSRNFCGPFLPSGQPIACPPGGSIRF
jgi:hypothetical protein